MMKNTLVHAGYFIILIALSIFSFFFIFGSGFVGDLNASVFVFLSILSMMWVSSYAWSVLRIESSSAEVDHTTRIKNWYFVSIHLAGTCTVFNLFLSTMFPTPPFQLGYPWIFIGTPLVMFIIWLSLFYRYAKNKNKPYHSIMSFVLLFLSLLYSYQVCSLYMNQLF